MELYGNHKAKVSLSVLKDNQDKPDGKLVINWSFTAITKPRCHYRY
ncbi:hypothetical protein DOZ58_04020 [Acetobacterium sp. KB-1]|nr:hypothetical protein DOZ58_04020 [Acetobacterium sp. KB-1]